MPPVPSSSGALPIVAITEATAQNARNIADTAMILVHSGALATAMNAGLATPHATEPKAAIALRHGCAQRRKKTPPARSSANASIATAMLSMDYWFPVVYSRWRSLDNDRVTRVLPVQPENDSSASLNVSLGRIAAAPLSMAGR